MADVTETCCEADTQENDEVASLSSADVSLLTEECSQEEGKLQDDAKLSFINEGDKIVPGEENSINRISNPSVKSVGKEESGGEKKSVEENDSDKKRELSVEREGVRERTESMKETKNNEVSDVQVTSPKESEGTEFSPENFELIDGHYYYTDVTSRVRYRYDTEKGEWVESGQDGGQTTTDSEGRTYYYADDLYLCRDTEDHVFFMDEKREWRPWEERAGNQSNQNHWYFYQDDNMFYRDRVSGVVYKLNKEDNKWEKFEGKLRKKRLKIDEEEEFDTDEDEESDRAAPPGAQSDPNITYDGTTYTKVDSSDKMQYEWNVERRAWFPKVDEDFMATYQLSYGFNPDGTKNDNPLKFDDDEEEKEEARLREEEELKKAKEKENQKKKPTWFEMDDTYNTKVYVSNLPDDMTQEKFIELMQKCGMLLLDPHSGQPKVKLYHDKEGNFKGDALCSYIKVESVNLAEQILDDYDVGGRRIHVERAKFQQKGDYNPKLKPRKKPKKELEKIQRRQEKLFDWRPDPLRGERHKHEMTAIIRNVFHPDEFKTAMEKILDHKEAIRNQCSNFGMVKKLELFDLHSEGVVKVTFEEVESADMCVATLNKRLYCGRTLTVATWDGKEKFRIEETKAQEEVRLKKWNQFLENDSSTEKTQPLKRLKKDSDLTNKTETSKSTQPEIQIN